LAASQLETFVRVVHACHECRESEGTEFFAKFETAEDLKTTKCVLGDVSSGYHMYMMTKETGNNDLEGFLFIFRKSVFLRFRKR